MNESHCAPAGLPKRKPLWLKRPIHAGSSYQQVQNIIRRNRLHTVCQEAQCPNRGECFSRKTATFLILGSRCSRNCRFCAVDHGPSGSPDPDEPVRVAEAVAKLDLEYAVITSVTRDDLPDGGSSAFSATINAIRKKSPGIFIEVLIPDFQGQRNPLKAVLEAGPDVLNHNIETVARLYSMVRPEAEYHRSLNLLSGCREMHPALPLKSGLMLGLGETPNEIIQTFGDLYDNGCRILTLGQYLQPTKSHLPVVRFLPPSEFEALRRSALDIGFKQVASGPFVRSSYNAKHLFGGLAKKPDGATHEEIHDPIFNRK